MLKFQVIEQNKIIDDYKKLEEKSAEIDQLRQQELKIYSNDLTNKQKEIDQLQKKINKKNWLTVGVGITGIVVACLCLFIK